MYDGSKLATVGCTSAGEAIRTSPAPERKAEAPQSAAAPAIPRPPATTSTEPYRPLWLSAGRFGRAGMVSTGSRAMTVSGGRWRNLVLNRGRGPGKPGLTRAPGDQARDVAAVESRVDVHHDDV